MDLELNSWRLLRRLLPMSNKLSWQWQARSRPEWRTNPVLLLPPNLEFLFEANKSRRRVDAAKWLCRKLICGGEKVWGYTWLYRSHSKLSSLGLCRCLCRNWLKVLRLILVTIYSFVFSFHLLTSCLPNIWCNFFSSCPPGNMVLVTYTIKTYNIQAPYLLISFQHPIVMFPKSLNHWLGAKPLKLGARIKVAAPELLCWGTGSALLRKWNKHTLFRCFE